MGKQWKAWTLLIAAVLAVLLLAYAIWPVVGFARIASAFEARDGAALAKLVDFHALRKSLTKQIVEAQGGQVGVSSTVGKGSLFYAVLPRHPSPVAAGGS